MGKPDFNPVRDIIAGLIMACTSVPQLIAYAETVGYASYRGLATAGPSLMAYAIATGSPWLNAGVTSVTALMAKSDLNGEAYMADHGEEAYVKLVAAYSIYIAIASAILALVGFGQLAQKCPSRVAAGFKWGCALGVLVSALPNGLLAAGSSEMKANAKAAEIPAAIIGFLKGNIPAAVGAVNLTNLTYTLINPLSWGLVPFAVFLVCTAVVMEGPKYLPKALPPGSEVILATAAATLYSMNTDYPGGVVGEIPTMDPDAGVSLFGVQLPVDFVPVQELMDAPVAEQFGGFPMMMISATLFSAVNFLSVMGILTGFETENQIAWSAPRELIAQGIGCAVSGFTGAAPVSGSMSRSLVSRMAGTTSKMAALVTATFWMLCLPYMNIMSPTPKAALSSVIVSAVVKSVIFPKSLNKLKGADFFVGWSTAILTATLNPTMGFGFGLILSISVDFLAPKKEKKL
mmetsp:Transcript_11459/g.17274  ORF Transcript_11459/g.17274 Transcript_11459/m.17274 type:complete len:460 (+) Transcript_11459:111-1490(+)|eukprot:CAMPEP_0196812778 /NCGR_PEP_ID=MMETSP1362-20130617/30819_1 /TAXON_ID=163516 /ORGANISM="Leptocylindrus danicus, Strain CCMP1856" /LENGTH=459 /DNA_ID=CAMNT_0042188657 /DNA_START=88 /DNA_END=1467 /DNA_ORIENTATION=-